MLKRIQILVTLYWYKQEPMWFGIICEEVSYISVITAVTTNFAWVYT